MGNLTKNQTYTQAFDFFFFSFLRIALKIAKGYNCRCIPNEDGQTGRQKGNGPTGWNVCSGAGRVLSPWFTFSNPLVGQGVQKGTVTTNTQQTQQTQDTKYVESLLYLRVYLFWNLREESSVLQREQNSFWNKRLRCKSWKDNYEEEATDCSGSSLTRPMHTTHCLWLLLFSSENVFNRI